MFDLILWILAGMGAGIIAGLLPGIHPNTFTAGLLVILPWLLTIASPTALVVFVITCVVSNNFFNFIPSVFIGAPEAETAMGVLPGHQMMLDGKGYEAVWLSTMGGFGVIVLSIALAPILFLTLPVMYNAIKGYMFWLLAAIIAMMFWTETGWKKGWGLIVFLFSGVFGILVLGSPLMSPQWLLFPVFTGLFGFPTLIVSIKSGQKMPEQTTIRAKFHKLGMTVGVVKGWLSGIIVGILPGIGPAQAAAVVQETTRKKDTKEFLISMGGIATVSSFFSLLALYLIDKPRSGAAIAVQQILGSFGFREMTILMATTVLVAGISVILTLKLTAFFAKIIQRSNYKQLNLAILIGLVALVAIMTGVVGLFVLGVATAIGLIAPLAGTKRTHAMGVLMLPIMLWYFPL